MNSFINLYDVRVKLNDISYYRSEGNSCIEILMNCGKVVGINCGSKEAQLTTLELLDDNI